MKPTLRSLAALGLALALGGCCSCGCKHGKAQPSETVTAAARTPAPVAPPQRPYVAPAADAAAAGLGTPLSRELAWRDVRGGREGTAGDLLGGANALVVVSTALRCPLTRLYAPYLRERLDPWVERGVRVLVLDTWAGDDEAALAARANELGWEWPVAKDAGGEWAAALKAERTTDVFLIDADGRLRYRGALDDQFGFGYRLERPRQRYLDEALEAVLDGRDPPVAATRAPGCALN